MTKNSQFDQRTEQARQEEAAEILGISKEQGVAIKLIAERFGDQIGHLATSLIEETLIIMLSGQHQYTSPIIPSSATVKPSSPPAYKLLRAVEVAKILDISRTQAYAMMRRGDIPTVRIGNSTRVKPEDLKDYINNKRISDI
jgi:excisionase family DNA binding protein